MKKIAFALIGATALVLAGCGSKAEDELGNNVGGNTDMMMDNGIGMDEANDVVAEPENTATETNDVTPPAPPPMDEADEAAQNVAAM